MEERERHSEPWPLNGKDLCNCICNDLYFEGTTRNTHFTVQIGSDPPVLGVVVV